MGCKREGFARGMERGRLCCGTWDRKATARGAVRTKVGIRWKGGRAVTWSYVLGFLQLWGLALLRTGDRQMLSGRRMLESLYTLRRRRLTAVHTQDMQRWDGSMTAGR